MNGKEIFKDTPLLTEEKLDEAFFFFDNRKKYFDELKDCVDVLKVKYKDVVTGLWYIGIPSVDGGTQFVFRMKEEITDMLYRNRLHADIYEFTGHEMCYYITDDSIEDLNSIPIDEWIDNGSVYALFDEERGI